LFTTLDDLRFREEYLEGEKRVRDFVDEDSNVDIGSLVDNQRRIFLRVIEHYHRLLAGEICAPLRINIDGTAGTGKSYLIDAITKVLTDIARERGHKSPIIRLAPTGIAAFNIHGATLHQALLLPVRGAFSRLDGQQLLRLQGRFKPIRFIIIDEKSMIGRKMLSRVDFRLREAFPENTNDSDYFGGCSVLLFGDFGQLPPVGDTPLYDLVPRTGRGDSITESNNGRDVYMSMTENLQLNRIM